MSLRAIPLLALAGVLTALAPLAGCAEKPQTSTAKRADAAAWRGASGPYTDAGWKAGDAASWEEHLRGRAQRGQNEYARSTGQ